MAAKMKIIGRCGGENPYDPARFAAARAWLEKSQIHDINRQLALLFRCGFKADDLMLIIWMQDYTWSLVLRNFPTPGASP